MSKTIVQRFRFIDRDAGDDAAPIDWRWVALILATLFLNFSFFDMHGLDVAGFGPLAVDATVFCVAAISISLLFFIGPALAVRATQRSVLSLLDDSIGRVPTMAVRLCCVIFLLIWIARLVAIPTLWALPISNREASVRTGAIAVALLLFLFFTANQSIRTNVQLAMFSDKLGLAIVAAALIRVHDGWASILAGFGIAGLYPQMLQFTSGLSNLALYAAPFGLFAAQYAARISNRRQVSLTIGTGVTVPIFLALLLSSVVGMATAKSRFYQPSLNPTISMALMSHMASSASGPRMLVAGITAFGALRFGIRALLEYTPVICSRRLRWVIPGLGIAAIAILALWPYATTSTAVHDMCVKCIAVAAAVLTADLIMGSQWRSARRRFDAIGLIALSAGVGTALGLPEQFLWAKGQWWLPWLLPAYAVGFIATIVGRTVQRQSASRE